MQQRVLALSTTETGSSKHSASNLDLLYLNLVLKTIDMVRFRVRLTLLWLRFCGVRLGLFRVINKSVYGYSIRSASLSFAHAIVYGHATASFIKLSVYFIE